MGWMILILLDSLANFRFEYLYPLIMFFRSIYDSYKYQGLVSVLLFYHTGSYKSLSLSHIPTPHIHTHNSLTRVDILHTVCVPGRVP